MVEFALIAPLFFLISIGLLVTGVVVTHQIQLTNSARDAARALAVCGSYTTPNLTLPDATSCNQGDESTYVTNLIHQVNPSATVTSVSVVTIDSSGNVTPVPPGGTNDSSLCASPQSTTLQNLPTRYVQVQAQYSQPLFLPLIGKVLGTNGTNNRTLTATAVAECEQ